MSFQKIVIGEARRQKLSGYAIAKLTKGRVSMRMVQGYLSESCDMAGERIAAVCEVLGLGLSRVRRGKARR